MAKRQAPARTTASGRVRCAIYTRKSTEEGLDQEFNSLDAQREACAAYILSQRHEGWTLLPDRYDDGGYSGGTMERPGLKQLLADVAAGKVDVIVIYKVDRLTRALSDFAKIVEVLDGAGASFVSVTQAFNTTTSMGRLMLNVLLSFAQFEREVTGERIRDKVAASKRKGMWMGGTVPLGYDVHDKKLIVNEAEAKTVRHIYRRYIELGSIVQLAIELDEQGIRSKARPGEAGDQGSRKIGRGAVAHMLSNRLYLGEVAHKGAIFPGEHAAIIDRALWNRVQAQLADHRTTSMQGSPARQRSLLTGRIRDAEGRFMTPVHANKDGRRYRYYVTGRDQTGRLAQNGWRLPAGEIEQLVLDNLCTTLRDQNVLAGLMASSSTPLAAILQRGRELAEGLGDAVTRHQVMAALGTEVQVAERQVTICIDTGSLTGNDDDDGSAPLRHSIIVPARLTRRGQELRMAYPPGDARASTEPDVKLVGLIAKAEAAHRELIGSDSIDRIKRGHLTRLARLRYLAPDIVTAILDGRHPVELSARKLLRADTIPLDWQEQRRALGFA